MSTRACTDDDRSRQKRSGQPADNDEPTMVRAATSRFIPIVPAGRQRVQQIGSTMPATNGNKLAQESRPRATTARALQSKCDGQCKAHGRVV